MAAMSKRASRRREIRQVLALREQEGFSLRALSERFGIPIGTLSWWSHRLRSEESTGFAEVRVVDRDGRGRTSNDEGESSSLVRLRFPAGVVAEFEGAIAQDIAYRLLDSVAD